MSEPNEPDAEPLAIEEMTEDDLKGGGVHPQAPGDEDEPEEA